ncbi:hypothetical protein BH09MYX1_BH09MYX1_46730 [soil metagenome]
MGLLDFLKGLFGGGDAAQPEGQPQAASPPAAEAPAHVEAAAAPEEEASSDDDGERRNYDLEAKDDQASFDLANDLAKWYTAEFRIEQAWEDVAGRAKLWAEYGIRDFQHYHQVKATVERFIQSPAAQAKYGEIGDIMHIKMKATQDFMMAGMQARTQGELKGEVEPVEGVSLEKWAEAMVKTINGISLDAITKDLGIDKATWDRVSAEWNARMSRDTTATIATVYGQAFTKAQANPATAGAAGPSKYAAAAQNPGKGDMPMTLERYVEVLEAQNALTAQGQDAQAVLKKLDLSVLDWSNLGAWFSAYINDNALRNNSAIINDYNRFTEKYKAKYATVKSDADISF